MKVWRRCYRILKRTGTLQIFMGFLAFLCAASAVLAFVEPDIHTFREGLWYCFVAATTIGFGDICAVTAIGRTVTVMVGVYGILMTAMVPGVVVSYYMEYLRLREKETISVFLEKLERLPELSKEELEELSEKIRKFSKERL